MARITRTSQLIEPRISPADIASGSHTEGPIQIECFVPNATAGIRDGLHRLWDARKRKDKTIAAVVRYYDARGRIVETEELALVIDR